MRSCGRLLSIVVAIAAAACSNNPNAPSQFPPIGGNYQATFRLDFANAVDQQTVDITGTISLSDPNVNGDFDGSYAYDPPTSGGGHVAGTIAMDGSIVISEWGDPGAPPILESDFLTVEWPHCDFTSVTANGMTGTLTGGGLSLQGQLAFPCAYTNGASIGTFPTTLTESVTGQ
jgi:hypothetical protein